MAKLNGPYKEWIHADTGRVYVCDADKVCKFRIVQGPESRRELMGIAKILAAALNAVEAKKPTGLRVGAKLGRKAVAKP
jgi:hypothetical protein